MSELVQKTQKLDPATDFMVMHAFCVTYWARVDETLFRIFHHCIGPYEQSVILYYRIDSLSVRLDTTNEIVRSVLPKPARKSGDHDHPSVKAWKDAQKGFHDLLGVRRRLAHQQLSPRIDYAAIEKAAVEGGLSPFYHLEIHTSRHEGIRSRSADEQPLTIKDLQSHAVDLARLRQRLTEFYDNVLSKHVPKSPPSVPLLKSPRDPDTYLSKEERPPPESSLE
jgi:hypothetical protein